MKVCMVVQGLHQVGGTERQVSQLTQSLIAKGANVFIITNRHHLSKELTNNYNIPLVQIFTINLGKLLGITFSFLLPFSLWKKRKDYQILHIHGGSFSSSVAILSGKLLKKRTILKIVGEGNTANLQNSLFGRIQWNIWRKVDAFICLSKKIEKELAKFGAKESQVKRIPNGVDIGLFKPVSQKSKETLKRRLSLPLVKIVTFTGRLEPGKGVDVLLEGWRSIIQEYQEVCLLIIGDGRERKHLEKLAKKYNITQKVIFLGNRNNINEYLQASDIFVFPSWREGLSNAVLEAMACSLPVVATDIGGTEELIKNGENGVLIKKDNSQELAQAILSLIRDERYAQEIGERARFTVEKGYSLESISSQYLSFYQEMAKIS